ncbi:MAG: hypothetical protein D6806_05135, partial [Deltaproteobacteria bacterium]
MKGPYPAQPDPFGRLAKQAEALRRHLSSWTCSGSEWESLQLLHGGLDRFLRDRVDDAAIDERGSFGNEILEHARNLGLFGLSIPQEHGGFGFTLKACCEVVQRIAYHDRSLGVTVGLHAGLGTRPLVAYGSEELKGRHLPRMASGETIGCFCATEPEAGSDIASLKTRAVLDGDRFVLNGSKAFVTNAGLAGLATVVARTDGLDGSRRGHSLLLVPLDLPGIELGPEEHKLGIRGSSTRPIYFEGVRLPRTNLLGEPNRGLDQLGYVLCWGRTIMAAGCLGLARRALRTATEHVAGRKQFGRALAQFPAVQRMLAERKTELHLMKLLLRACGQFEADRPGSISWESALAKVFCSEAAWRACDDCLQLHGGSGFIEDTGVALLLRDARIGRIFEGANEVLRHHMGLGLIGAGKSGEHVASLCETAGIDGEPRSRLESMAQRLDGAIEGLKKRYGVR